MQLMNDYISNICKLLQINNYTHSLEGVDIIKSIKLAMPRRVGCLMRMTWDEIPRKILMMQLDGRKKRERQAKPVTCLLYTSRCV